jgi:hypothetical protein
MRVGEIDLGNCQIQLTTGPPVADLYYLLLLNPLAKGSRFCT